MSADTINNHFEKKTDRVVASSDQIINVEAERKVVTDLVSSGLDHSAFTAHKPDSFQSSIFKRAVL